MNNRCDLFVSIMPFPVTNMNANFLVPFKLTSTNIDRNISFGLFQYSILNLKYAVIVSTHCIDVLAHVPTHFHGYYGQFREGSKRRRSSYDRCGVMNGFPLLLPPTPPKRFAPSASSIPTPVSSQYRLLFFSSMNDQLGLSHR